MQNAKTAKLAVTAAVQQAVKARKNTAHNMLYIADAAFCYNTVSVYKHACKQILSNLNKTCLNSLIAVNTRVFKTIKFKQANSTRALYSATLNNVARTKVTVTVNIHNLHVSAYY
jgi:hypothetical protein